MNITLISTHHLRRSTSTARYTVVLAPHQASATVETRRAMGELLVENLVRHFTGKPVLTPVE